MTPEYIEKFCIWLMWAHGYVERRRVLRDYQLDLTDAESADLQIEFDKQEKIWNAMSKPEREMFRNRMRVEAMQKLGESAL